MPIPGWTIVAPLVARARAQWRALTRRGRTEHDMQEELRHHIDARTDDLVARGLARDEAETRARREFGHATSHRTASREALGLASFAQVRFSWLDLKLALRMLPKHPVLNLAAVFALAVGIPVALAPSHLARALEAPLPGDTEGRLRAIRHWDPVPSAVAPTYDTEFQHWAASLRGFSSLGAFGMASVSVAPVDGPAVPVAAATLSPSVFAMLGARPMLGRVLEARDFDAGAPNAVVIGAGLWASRFGSDPAIIGRSIRIGRDLHTVVGVMPRGFAFPSTEALWMPMRTRSVGGAAAVIPVHILGRLADGVSAEDAQQELTRLGRLPLPIGADATDEDARARLRAEVVPFGLLFLGLPAGGLASLPEYRLVQAITLALMLVACGNVAMLMFARTATRLRELAIRTALGATRTRILSQLFIEALLIAVLAAGLGVFVADRVLARVNLAALAGEAALPYWLSLDITRGTALAALAFAAACATLAGVLPAIVITGRAIAQHIGGASRVRFGRVTGALVVADIAVSVAAVGMAIAVVVHATDLQRMQRATGIDAARYLAVEVHLPLETVARDAARLADGQRALIAALEREPGVRRVAVGDVLPRMEHRSRPFELDDAGRSTGATRRWTRVARVDADFMSALDAPIVSGRGFTAADADDGRRVAIVNSAFVATVLEGRDPLGVRVRFPVRGERADAAWHEIIGVVGPLGVSILNPERGEAVYLPAAAGTLTPMRFAVQADVAPATLAPRVREIIASVDPDLVVTNTTVLSEVRQGDWYLVMGLAGGLVALASVLVALATSGLYAMLSLAVSDRTREIGIRAALGAPRARLLFTILRRPLTQIAVGAVIGLPIAGWFLLELALEGGGSPAVAMVSALGLAAGIVALVGVGSCLVPMRRVMAVEASEAMRAES